MPFVDIKGTHVNFPFTPYECQLTYMQKVLECLQTNQNGILESPTGTGKTLCLLCAALAWLQDRKAQTELNRQANISSLMGNSGNLLPSQLESLAKNIEQSTGMTWGGSEFAVPKIIYASRTHSQLSQAVQEMKRTAYNTMKVSVIGSRDQLCIHEHVRKETNNTNKVHMCRAKVAGRTCHYYNRFEEIKRNSDARSIIGDVVDIEDMITYGEKQRVCPYYMSRELKNDADIIFMPYNYLLDPKSRKAQGVEIQGNILIFDEAHNLEKICEDSSSFDLSPGDLATAIEELNKLSVKLFEMAKNEESSLVEATDSSVMPDPEFTLEEVLRMKSTLVDLESHIDEVEVSNPDKGVTKPGIFIFELFSKVNIGFETKNFFIDLLDKIISFLTSDSTGLGFHSKGTGLSKIADVIKIVFSREVVGGSIHAHQEVLSKCYKVHIQQNQQNFKKKKLDTWASSGSNDKMGKTLSYWCFSPGHSMLDMAAHGVKCIILTSGTLSPLSSFSAEMQIPFPVTLENPHVIEKHQVLVRTLGKGPDNVTLNSNYQTRFTESYQSSLGKAVVNFARVVPKGLLIFFSSYPVMEKCIEHWQSNGIYNTISQYKPIYVEPREKGLLNDVMEEFYQKINDPALNGAIFAAVCRGKVSEGLDFSDNNGRAVIITGLPYPPRMDPKVVLKMQFLDESKGKLGFKSLTGQEWYKQQASRAVNQAIGRVIRHRNDFGAILLCDTRFSAYSAISQLPLWIRPLVNNYDVFGKAIKDVIVFFKTAEAKMPTAIPKARRVGGSVGSSGASFLPTFSKVSAPSSTKARTVADHVPSLKQGDDESGMAKLKIQYEGQSASSASSNRKKGLLDALSYPKSNRFDDSFEGNDESSSKMSMKKMPNKKKIIIKKRDPQSDKITTETVVVSHVVTPVSIQSAEAYIAEVKKCLGSTQYKEFALALRDYKKTEDFEKCSAVMASLFTEKKEDYYLFRQFYRFVRAKDKKNFDELCRNLTGLSCGYKPEDSVTRKRLCTDSDTSESNQLNKKQKTEAASTTTGTSTLGNIDNCNIESATTLGNLQVSYKLDDKVESKEEGTTQKKGSHETECIDKNSTEGRNTEVSLSQKENVPRCRQVDRDTSKPLDIRPDTNDRSGYKCCKCNEDARVPFKANCDHICCFKCWRQVFEENKLCPGCQIRVRRRNLVQLLYPGPHSTS